MNAPKIAEEHDVCSLGQPNSLMMGEGLLHSLQDRLALLDEKLTDGHTGNQDGVSCKEGKRNQAILEHASG